MQNLEYFRRQRDEKQSSLFNMSLTEVNQINKARADVILFGRTGLPNGASINRLKRAYGDYQPYQQGFDQAEQDYKRHKANIGLYGFSVNATR